MPDEKEGIDKSGGDYLPADEAARLTGAEQERRSREGRAAAPHREISRRSAARPHAGPLIGRADRRDPVAAARNAPSVRAAPVGCDAAPPRDPDDPLSR